MDATHRFLIATFQRLALALLVLPWPGHLAASDPVFPDGFEPGPRVIGIDLTGDGIHDVAAHRGRIGPLSAICGRLSHGTLI